MTPRVGEGSAARIFLFVSLRSLKNSLLALLRRLREPRYLIGFALGVIYFSWIFGRNRFATPPPRTLTGPWLSPETLSAFLLVAAGAFTVFILGSWVLRHGRADLSLTEAEAQFFFSAPLSSRAVTHYALLRPMAMVLFGSFFVVLFAWRGDVAGRLPKVLGTWVVLSTLRLHWLGIAFARASWAERGRVLRDRLATFAALGLLAALLFGFAESVKSAAASMAQSGTITAEAVASAVSTGRLAVFLGLLTIPARTLLAPLFAPDLAAFLPRFLLALGILAIHYFWVLHASSGYEEATLEGAVRRTERRKRRLAGRMPTSVAPRRRRGIVPFDLAATRGRPEAGIVWKNLISWHRVRLTRLARNLALACLLLYGGARFLSSLGYASAGVGAAVAVLFFAGVLALTLPIAPRHDLREDLENLEVLRAWPLSPTRLVAAELATPWLLSMGFLVAGFCLSVSIAAGSQSRHLPPFQPPMPFDLGRDVLSIAAPIVLAALFLIPAAVAFVVLVQNGLTLAFPAWFRQRERRVTSLERTGSAMVTMLVTLFVLAVAALPYVVIAGGLSLFFGRTLGVWIVPLAAVLSSVPLWGAVFLAVRSLAVLYEIFDPSLDLGP